MPTPSNEKLPSAVSSQIERASDRSTSLDGQQFTEIDPAVHKAIIDTHAVISHTRDGMILIKSVKGDPDSPRSWPNWKRYCIVILASFLNNLVRRKRDDLGNIVSQLCE